MKVALLMIKWWLNFFFMKIFQIHRQNFFVEISPKSSIFYLIIKINFEWAVGHTRGNQIGLDGMQRKK